MRTRIRELSQSAGNLTTEVLIQIGRLRLLAWDASGERLFQARTAREVWLDDHDQHTARFIIENDERLTAAARLIRRDKIGRAKSSFYLSCDGSRSLSSGAHSRDPLAPPILRAGEPLPPGDPADDY
jgi:hypothetical protein